MADHRPAISRINADHRAGLISNAERHARIRAIVTPHTAPITHRSTANDHIR